MLDNTDWGHSLIEGDPVGPNDTIVKYTYNGDSNLDGQVDQDDFNAFVGGFNNGVQPGPFPADWFHGDYNYDGQVDQDDFQKFLDGLAAFNASGHVVLSPALQSEMSSFASASGIALDPTPTPEPAGLGVLGVLGAGLIARRRKA